MQTADVISRLKSVEPQLRAFGVAGLYIFGSYAGAAVESTALTHKQE
jgi:hypothetical protein